VLISFVFLPLLLQSHGRRLTGVLAVIIAVFAAMVLKFVFAWVGMRLGGTSSRDAMRNSASMVGPGEVAILFLGFGITRWVIDAPVYFGILGYALLSSVLIPLVWRSWIKRHSSMYQSSPEEVQANVF
jgi:Kef-type K+ transport system membrane component KefB